MEAGRWEPHRPIGVEGPEFFARGAVQRCQAIAIIEPDEHPAIADHGLEDRVVVHDVAIERIVPDGDALRVLARPDRLQLHW
jgi:hypothetical protein